MGRREPQRNTYVFTAALGVLLGVLAGQLHPAVTTQNFEDDYRTVVVDEDVLSSPSPSFASPSFSSVSPAEGEWLPSSTLAEEESHQDGIPVTAGEPPDAEFVSPEEDTHIVAWDVTSNQAGSQTMGPSYTVGGAEREGHFTPQSRVLLPVTLDLRSYTSLSFRTCSRGQLLHQEGHSGDKDALSLAIDEAGALVLNLWRLGQPHTTILGDRTLNDNAWHRVYLRFELGVLWLGLDNTTVMVANTTGPQSHLIDLFLWSPEPELVVGGGFTGCLLQGANTKFTDPLAKHFAVNWGQCPLPDGQDCRGYNVDPCFTRPCGHHGRCVATGEEYTCDCFIRYSGTNCEVDTGPLCSRDEFQCQNGGLCQEDRSGNFTTCACQLGFAGHFCETAVHAVCEEDLNPCQNNGSCFVTEFGDSTECTCGLGFGGEHCEENLDDCTSSPCLHGGVCVDGVNDFTCHCSDTGYRGNTCNENIDECLNDPCQNGASCLDMYGGFECACVPGYTGSYCELEVRECMSDPCQNGGTCTDLQNSYQCSCLLGFQGDNCQVNIDDCYNISCPENSYCMDGVNEYVCRCNPGFSGSPPECLQIDECNSSPCQNGGTCDDQVNGYTCSCEAGFTGMNCEENIDDCQLDPCQNGGTCVDDIESYTCMCPLGYQGTTCEINVDECALNVCLHSISCTDLEGDYQCICEPGWSGRNCDVDEDNCLVMPCANGATCTDRLGGFDCACMPGYTGAACETNIDECISSPCLNGGTCVDGINEYTCRCGDMYMGEHCESEFDACAPNPCQNGGTCNYRNDRDFYCDCPLGYEGLNCTHNVDDCIDVQCPDGKVCFDLVNNYECRCPLGFTGSDCTVNVDECASLPCQNGGECHDGINNYTCVCPPGYTGKNCEEDVNECEPEGHGPCVNGICTNTVGSYQCYCQPGFAGDHCQLEFDECLSHPCKNNGSCINIINGYECRCQPGFTGADCDGNIDECASNPCQNNATCIDGIAMFTCDCLPGFTDDLCATNIDECESDPCLHGGTCVDGINEYTCNCTDTGFKGDECEINIDDCASSPCQHGSTCSDQVKDYICGCFDGYTGKNCEEDIAECSSTPCLNSGTCLERSNRTLYEDLQVFQNFSYETAGGYECQCVPGYTGINCEINIDECAPGPCVHGTCEDGINAYSCSCWPGYEGYDCEIEIDECERYIPCVQGNCVDKLADYMCECNEGFGGKNCSVALEGCLDVVCENGGTCEALLYDEITHDFKCHCPHGFTGDTCRLATTLSMAGESYVRINSDRLEGYELKFRFRTTLPNGILALGQGQTYFSLDLIEGRLNLKSSFLNEWAGIFSGGGLDDGEWHNVIMRVNDSHANLIADQDVTIHPVTSSQSTNNVSETSFSTTYLGGATQNLKILSKGTYFFTGCMEDAAVNEYKLVPSLVTDDMWVNMMEGCSREEQCKPSPCLNGGECFDLWNDYECACVRPYLGRTCRLSFTPATFGNENAPDSLVTVIIPEIDRTTFRTHIDISMIVRTRERNGLIFYLGTPIDFPPTDVLETYLKAQLEEGKLVISVQLTGTEENFTIADTILYDGEPHLLSVQKVESALQVSIDNKIHFSEVIEQQGVLHAHVLYLGGLPQNSSFRYRRELDDIWSRVKRQLGVSNVTANVIRPNFKGILQDVRLSNGTETRLVQTFPLNAFGNETYELPGTVLNSTVMHNVLEGEVSDDTCTPDPCENGATCNITWNDFECTCPFGFKGKTCSELEYCEMHSCPAQSECQNLDDGYECVASITFNGINSSLTYIPNLTHPPEILSNISIVYRSKMGGVLLYAQNIDATVTISALPDGVFIQLTNGTLEQTSSHFASNQTLDGLWHLLTVTFHPLGMQVFLNGTELIGTDPTVIIDFKYLIITGEVHVGSLPFSLASYSLLTISPDISNANNPINTYTTPLQPPAIRDVFRGCLGEVRIQEVLLPFFSQRELINNTAANQFLMQEERFTKSGCAVCYDHECENGGFCADPSNIYECQCMLGFESDLCEVNIDECLGHNCTNGAQCEDGINSYTCRCQPGYAGIYCETDIDECESLPCLNGGTCSNEISRFVCTCTEEFIGPTCGELKVKNCSNHMCQHGAACHDVYNPVLGIADNYTCDCPFGYKGHNCDVIIDFCVDLAIDCVHGDCFVTQYGEGWKCGCYPGYEGLYCDLDINECASNPCHNGAQCEHGIDTYDCRCTEGWEGPTCTEDIDECASVRPCKNGANCINKPGSFICDCPDFFCGQTCQLSNPCIEPEINCTNDGICIPLCDEFFPDSNNQTRMYCKCPEGWGGIDCSEQPVSPLSSSNLAIIVGSVVGLMVLIAIVGLTVFLMMAKKKRATRGTYSPSRQVRTERGTYCPSTAGVLQPTSRDGQHDETTSRREAHIAPFSCQQPPLPPIPAAATTTTTFQPLIITRSPSYPLRKPSPEERLI
ncbi:cell polarity complex component crumbs isoform X2 [Oratosquilla oratoria]|uniref:cell polarity complex component crumbs isoform X2 n=1 Tax=Oratosquilla oratoria TaxID=337810 RepID=UPI003F76F024